MDARTLTIQKQTKTLQVITTDNGYDMDII